MYNNNKYHTKGAGSILACEIFYINFKKIDGADRF